MPHSPLELYRAQLAQGAITADSEQARAITELNRLWQELAQQRKPGFWRRLTGVKGPGIRGLYLWGGVGRGKTWMMDLFFESLPFAEKQRIHFHRFMARVHDALKARSSSRDPLRDIAREWAAQYRVLCFDEFFVSDIADAMLLAGLLEALFEHGVTLVVTSNVAPDSLYRDGLQRARFLPAIELIKKHNHVLEVGGETDFRLRILERTEIYHHPLDLRADELLAQGFENISGGLQLHPVVEINGRSFAARRRGDGVIWFDFNELCVKPCGPLDYMEIARSFNTVLLSGVPAMDDNANDAARRFINLVDEFYDRNVKLLVSAEQPAGSLYRGSRLAFEYQRTASRLTEMQSHEYLGLPHLP